MSHADDLPAPINTTTADGRLFQGFGERSPCDGCAGCCRQFRVSFYHGELDVHPGGCVPADLTTQVTPHLACMKGTELGEGRCIALSRDGRCTIYDRRPSTCREFLAILPDGRPNPECKALRERWGTPRD